MQTRHVPRIDVRYWCGIFFASVFGTNLGDFYAHESGLGLGLGLLVLAALFSIVYVVEKKDSLAHEMYYGSRSSSFAPVLPTLPTSLPSVRASRRRCLRSASRSLSRFWAGVPPACVNRLERTGLILLLQGPLCYIGVRCSVQVCLEPSSAMSARIILARGLPLSR
jgi:hypothetical protein